MLQANELYFPVEDTMSKKFDYLIVGAGLFGAVFAHEVAVRGKTCLVIDRREHIAGNVYTKEVEGIQVHEYGAHIFHTSDEKIWNYVNQFATFNRFTNSPLAIYKGELYHLPFNMNTFSKLWGIKTPKEAMAIIEEQRKEIQGEPKNLEEQAISLVGRDIYEKLVQGYTQKQWGHACTELPAFIIRRLPVRFTYDNNYFNDLYQGIPIGGYTKMVEAMLNHKNITVQMNTDYFDQRQALNGIAETIVYTGMIDQYFNYCYGTLEYRSLRFESELLDESNYQGNAVVNYTEYEVPFTRIIEHKHFEFGTQEKTMITREYPSTWKPGDEPYYPVNNESNNAMYQKYKTLGEQEKNVIFGGRLAEYKYYDMHQVIASALECVERVMKQS